MRTFFCLSVLFVMLSSSRAVAMPACRQVVTKHFLAYGPIVAAGIVAEKHNTHGEFNFGISAGWDRNKYCTKNLLLIDVSGGFDTNRKFVGRAGLRYGAQVFLSGINGRIGTTIIEDRDPSIDVGAHIMFLGASLGYELRIPTSSEDRFSHMFTISIEPVFSRGE